MKKKRKILILILIVIVSSVAILSAVMSTIDSNLKALVGLSISDVDLTNTQNGTYSGSYKVFPISVKVEVTILDHEINSIVLMEHINGQGTPAEMILNSVMEKQTLNVDVISGSTYSSVVILKAIESALNNSI